MNLDCHKNKWLSSSYHLQKLAKMVEIACYDGLFNQLVDVPTRFEHNSVTGQTSYSCIDHVYTNHKFRCSKVEVVPFGNSDHDLIEYIRYLKDPPSPTTKKVIQKLYFVKLPRGLRVS